MPFRWAFDLTQAMPKQLRARVEIHAFRANEKQANLKAAVQSRRTARGILWYLATENDPELAVHPSRMRRLWHGFGKDDAQLLEQPIEITGYRLDRGAMRAYQVDIWDRASTCVAHAINLLLTDFQGLKSKARACRFIEGANFETLDWKGAELLDDPRLHFFVGSQSGKQERGEPQRYCCTKHQRRHYMGLYRARSATESDSSRKG